MKKAIVIILSIVLLLGLAACGHSENGEPAQKKGLFEVPMGEPTEQEQEEIRRYCIIMDALSDMERGVEAIFYYEKFGMESERDMEMGQKALSLLYNQLTQLEAVDKWAGTQWADDPSINWDRQAVLDSFTVIEDVRIRETKTYLDFVSNRDDSPNENQWHYDENGRLIQSSGYGARVDDNHSWYFDSFTEQTENTLVNAWYDAHYAYDTQDRAAKIEFGSDGDIEAVVNFTYEDGRVVSAQTAYDYGRKGSANYVYDAQGRLAEVEYTEGEGMDAEKKIYRYEYDGRGNVLSERIESYNWDVYEDALALRNTLLTTYTYDDNGVPVSGVFKQIQSWNGQTSEMASEFVYTCDAQGRPVAVAVTCEDRIIPETGETVWESDYPACEVVIEYGDYYIYNPAQ